MRRRRTTRVRLIVVYDYVLDLAVKPLHPCFHGVCSPWCSFHAASCRYLWSINYFIATGFRMHSTHAAVPAAAGDFFSASKTHSPSRRAVSAASTALDRCSCGSLQIAQRLVPRERKRTRDFRPGRATFARESARSSIFDLRSSESSRRGRFSTTMLRIDDDDEGVSYHFHGDVKAVYLLRANLFIRMLPRSGEDGYHAVKCESIGFRHLAFECSIECYNNTSVICDVLQLTGDGDR